MLKWSAKCGLRTPAGCGEVADIAMEGQGTHLASWGGVTAMARDGWEACSDGCGAPVVWGIGVCSGYRKTTKTVTVKGEWDCKNGPC